MSEDDMFYCSFVSIHYIICECGETFPTEEDLKSHLEKEHPFKRERKEYKCGVCNATYNTEEECINHYENSHMEIKQEHDYAEPCSVKEESDYIEECDYTEECENTEEYQKSETEDNIQYDNIIQDGVQYDENFTEVYAVEDVISGFSRICEVCGMVFSGPGEHDCPIRQDDENNLKPKIIIRNGVTKSKRSRCLPKKIVCEVCGRKYSSNAALRYHQRVHTGERPYKCTACTKTFTMPLFLQIHQRTHTGERPYKCPYPDCTKAFSNKAALLRHDRVHTGIKPYGCPRCGKFFTQSNSMKLHVNTVHLKMPAPYKSKNRRNKKEREAALKLEEEKSAVKTIMSSLPENMVEARMQVIKKEEAIKMDESVFYDNDIESEVTYEVVYED